MTHMNCHSHALTCQCAQGNYYYDTTASDCQCAAVVLGAACYLRLESILRIFKRLRIGGSSVQTNTAVLYGILVISCHRFLCTETVQTVKRASQYECERKD